MDGEHLQPVVIVVVVVTVESVETISYESSYRYHWRVHNYFCWCARNEQHFGGTNFDRVQRMVLRGGMHLQSPCVTTQASNILFTAQITPCINSLKIVRSCATLCRPMYNRCWLWTATKTKRMWSVARSSSTTSQQPPMLNAPLRICHRQWCPDVIGWIGVDYLGLSSMYLLVWSMPWMFDSSIDSNANSRSAGR